MPGTTTVGGALRSAAEAVARPDRKAEAEALVARLTSGDVRCANCGEPTMHDGSVCYACCHLPEPGLTAPLSPAGERIGPAREARPGG